MLNPNTSAKQGAGRGDRGPHPGALAIVTASLFVASLIVTSLMTGGGRFPSPFETPVAAQAFFMAHADAVRIGAFLQFASAIPLGIFTAAVTGRLHRLGMRVPGVIIALFGGIAASSFTALSGLAQWALSDPAVAGQIATMRGVQMLAFGAGGPGSVVPLGLLLAGIAVPAYFGRLLPRWLVWTGLIIAAIAELSTLSLVIPKAIYLLPMARFPGFLWIIAAGYMLPRSGASRQRS